MSLSLPQNGTSSLQSSRTKQNIAEQQAEDMDMDGVDPAPNEAPNAEIVPQQAENGTKDTSPAFISITFLNIDKQFQSSLLKHILDFKDEMQGVLTFAGGGESAENDSARHPTVTIYENFVEDPSGTMAYKDQVPKYKNLAQKDKHKNSCWNCDSTEHELRNCPLQRNHAKIAKNRKIFMEGKEETTRFYKSKSIGKLRQKERITTPPTPLREEMMEIDRVIKEQNVPLHELPVRDTYAYAEETHIPFDLLGTVVEETERHKDFRRICKNLKARTRERRQAQQDAKNDADNDVEIITPAQETQPSIDSGSDFVAFGKEEDESSSVEEISTPQHPQSTRGRSSNRKRKRSHEDRDNRRHARGNDERDHRDDYRRSPPPPHWYAPPQHAYPYGYSAPPPPLGYYAPPSYGPPPPQQALPYGYSTPAHYNPSAPPPYHSAPPLQQSFRDRLDDIKRRR